MTREIRATRQKDGCWQVIVPADLSGGVRIRKRWSGQDAEKDAREYVKTVNWSRIGRAQFFEELNLSERSEVGGWVRDLREAFGVEWATLGRQAVTDAIKQRTCERTTVSEAVRECAEQQKRAKLSERYRKEFIKSLRLFEARFGTRDCDTVKSEEIEGWLHAQPWADYTKRTNLINIRTLFSFAVNRRFAAVNSAAKVPLPKTSKKRPRIFTPEEAERFMRAIEKHDPGLIRFVSMVMFGGLRTDEAMAVRPECITETVIDLPAENTKNNHRRLIEFSQFPNLKAWMDKKGDLPPKDIRRRLNAVRIAAGFTGFERTHKGKDGQRKVGGATWGKNILRKSFVSYAVEMFGQSRAALMADHSESVQGDTYRELVRRTDAERFWKILPL